MRIQHNITAMNSYSKYANNTSKVSKNLEKLSSGYKINRAGDDAAGLAISEKMRVQITGLEQAQQNAKSGISLVQTAEGALTEVHDMLNRMYTLAEQSSNGTYSNELDREQLQKEVDSLRTEINRIADSTNYNGINLLDGSLSSSGVKSADGTLRLDTDKDGSELVINTVAATKGKYSTTPFNDGVIKDGETMEFTVSLNNGENVTVSLTAKDYTDGTAGGQLVGTDGTVYGTYAAGGTTGPTAAELGKGMAAAMKDTALADSFRIQFNAAAPGSPLNAVVNSITLTNLEAGADAPQIMKDINMTVRDAGGNIKAGGETLNTLADNVKGVDAYKTIDGGQFETEYDGKETTIYTINDKKFAILSSTNDNYDALVKNLASDVILITVDKTASGAVDSGGTIDLSAADSSDGNNNGVEITGKQIATVLSKELGMDVSFVKGAGSDASAVASHFEFKQDYSIKNVGGDGLTLQIGDTSETFNKMTVSVNDMHATAMGIGKINISTQEGASSAMTAIKSAVNYVSDVRGDLGALQNRLDHTINNLGVMQENIQDAESVIRDTDVAKEMMNYTKNNILVQSAQAMLAQANQLPQGVLQLLQ